MSGRIMIAGAGSGSGKTTITCALLQAFRNRGLQVHGFKCGPDYIDPLFHSRVLGTKTRNLDACFLDANEMRWLLAQQQGDISLIEGVMGFYDGVGEEGSSCQIANLTHTPAIIVIDCKGMSMSVGAIMQGFLQFREPNTIAGFIFNRLPVSQIPMVQTLCQQLRTQYFGCFPYDKTVSIGSRHLGLVTAGEIDGLRDKVQRMADMAQKYIELDAILQVAARAALLRAKAPDIEGTAQAAAYRIPEKKRRLAVAKDAAFCFYYEENLQLLSALGLEPVYFSPLEDTELPEHCCGLLLGGGYPELYAKKLSDNYRMRMQIRNAVLGGLPTIAECGGFLYLHRQLESVDGELFSMADVFAARARRTDRLVRFGYVNLYADCDTMLAKNGETLAAHEFHYWDSEENGTAYQAVKRSNQACYRACVANDSLYAGFPHLYLGANRMASVRFAAACERYEKIRENMQ